ncbi:MAG: four helix bundle protein [Salinivirgaceae bacterium]|jgi:four helix bundle protein|nr:four helix bundle protein [Salinivirgaceae bacterium]
MEQFGYQELKVWQMAIEFADIMLDIADNKIPNNKHYRLKEQIESASVSVSSNIAEGKGRWSQKEFVHFLYIARGSLYETVSLLTIVKRRSFINETDFNIIMSKSIEISKALNGLIKSIKTKIKLTSYQL